MTIEYAMRDKYRNDRKEFVLHDRDALTFEARLAATFVEKWGMVAAAPDGEDSRGAQKLRLLTVEETVERAVDMATTLASRLREEGLIVELPPFADLLASVDGDA